MFLVHKNRRKRVLKYCASFVEAYAMLSMISSGFVVVPFEHQKHYATSPSYGTRRAILLRKDCDLHDNTPCGRPHSGVPFGTRTAFICKKTKLFYMATAIARHCCSNAAR